MSLDFKIYFQKTYFSQGSTIQSGQGKLGHRNSNVTSLESIYLEYISGFSPIFNKSLKDNKNKYNKYHTNKRSNIYILMYIHSWRKDGNLEKPDKF